MTTLIHEEAVARADFGNDSPLAGRPRRRRRMILAGLAVATAYALLPQAVGLEQDVAPRLPVDAGLVVPEYGAEGTHFLRYRHGETVTMQVPVTNRTPVPVTIHTLRLDLPAYALLAPVASSGLPVTLAPFEHADVELTLRFGNCRHYHERATQSVSAAVVTGTALGRSFTEGLGFEQPFRVHAQTIGDCPDRTLVRGDDARPR